MHKLFAIFECYKYTILFKSFLLILCIFHFAIGWSQVVQKDTLSNSPADSTEVEYYFFEGDSVPKKTIELDPVYLFQNLKFASYKDKVRYYILKRKTIKVYPYAKLAAERLTELTERLDRVKSKSKRRQYTKIIQRYIEDEFSAELKKLTRTEGQILVKLIHRQTGITTFNLVKELRSGWRAFWYNTTAKMFDIDLKREYHPESVHEDYLIEDILQRAFAGGKLERQETALNFDYDELSNQWRDQNKNISFEDKKD
ncbi:DUF4294 domain-containing protein [Galbibacter pacificus]|uniref:DUF4294 domain-containing protein n=1 Tax=Galbibacter pacificus TaxID=2996052 RepID=A0ABT6FPP8_9FLAO|nr:DUF4294 domain-containing protein [Galbibacter pacificus]MDG3581649.1 DUF4294 domain-containing protein [Galbibacter pacificus]MDG3585127.1 DUF4294 domain-containing protein [Galbibacter pacificus]